MSNERDSWKENLYLVCLFRGPLYNKAHRIQEELYERFMIEKNKWAKIHITLAVFSKNADVNRLKRYVSKGLLIRKPFPVYAGGALCFPRPHQTIALAVSSCSKLKKIRDIALNFPGSISVKKDGDWLFHITLFSMIQSGLPYKKTEYENLCERHNGLDGTEKGMVYSIQLWNPSGKNNVLWDIDLHCD